MTAHSEPGSPPALAIVAGNPSAEQIAAVVAVLSARATSAGPAASRGESGRSEWSARYRLLREPLVRAPGGWRASALPRSAGPASLPGALARPRVSLTRLCAVEEPLSCVRS